MLQRRCRRASPFGVDHGIRRRPQHLSAGPNAPLARPRPSGCRAALPLPPLAARRRLALAAGARGSALALPPPARAAAPPCRLAPPPLPLPPLPPLFSQKRPKIFRLVRPRSEPPRTNQCASNGADAEDQQRWLASLRTRVCTQRRCRRRGGRRRGNGRRRRLHRRRGTRNNCRCARRRGRRHR